MLSRGWGNPQAYRSAPRRPIKELKGVYQLKRPKSLAEVNHFKQTPYTRRVCATCRKQLYHHWYLVFLDSQKCSRLYCRRDGTAYHWKEKMRI